MRQRLILPFVVFVLSAVFVQAALPPKEKLHLYLLIGQSNMAGRGVMTEADAISNERILKLAQDNTWVPADEPLHFDKPVAGAGIGKSFARVMADAEPDITVGLIPCAVGGTPLERWMKGGDLYEQALVRAKLAMKDGTLKGILWHQGESDAGREDTAQSYGERLAQMIAAWRADLGEVPFVAGRLGTFLKETTKEGKPNFWKLVDAQIAALPEKVKLTAVASAEGLAHKGDDVHFDTAALRELGRRYAKAMQSLRQRPTALKAGAATSNITPEIGGDIIGGFLPFPSKHIHDELHARCLVLDDGRSQLAFVVCDLLGIHRSLSLAAREFIEKETGIPAAHVMISGTHTHSATSAISGAVREYTSDMELTDYQKFVARRIADGVRRAKNLLRPAEIAFGTIEVPEHVHVRRWFLKEDQMPPNPFGKIDKVKMNPGAGNPALIEPAGRPDTKLSFIALREPRGRMISLLSAYGLHYVGGVGDAHISADYFGYYCEALKRLVEGGTEDPPFVAIMANGTSGDVNNINFREPAPRKKAYEQMRYVAVDLAKKVHAALGALTWSGEAALAARYRELPLAWRKIDPELIEWAKETEKTTLRIQGKASLPLAYAGRVQRLALASPETKAPVQVLRIGDVCIATTPCETFAETGMEFRERSPIEKSFMIELAHGYYGYMPTPRHFELGGYETWPGTNNLEPQASVKMMDALLEMAAELKEK